MTRNADHVRRANAWQWGAIGVGSAAAVLAVGALVLSVTITPGQGTVLGGFGVLVGAGLAFYTGHASRTSRERIERDNAARAERELEQQQRHFDEQQRVDAADRAADRRAAITRDLRGRFTVAATQLADPSPAIRLAGVYSLIALADDWTTHDNTTERDVCVALLLSYLRAPQTDPEPDDDDALPHLHVRETIVRQVAKRTQLPTDKPRSWRSVEGVSFARCDLRRLDLRGAQLDGFDFTFALMHEVKLTDATLTGSTLVGAKLADAVLFRASLRRANLRRARCSGARFTGADLTEARASSADFTGASFSTAVLTKAKLGGANFANASFVGTTMLGAFLRRAKNLDYALLDEVQYDDETVWPADFTPPPPFDPDDE